MDRDNIPCVHVGTPVETSVEIAVEGGVLRSSGVRVERGEFQVGTLRDLLGLAVTFDLARTADAPYLVREHKR